MTIFWCKVYPISAMVLMVVFICLGLSSCEEQSECAKWANTNRPEVQVCEEFK